MSTTNNVPFQCEACKTVFIGPIETYEVIFNGKLICKCCSSCMHSKGVSVVTEGDVLPVKVEVRGV